MSQRIITVNESARKSQACRTNFVALVGGSKLTTRSYRKFVPHFELSPSRIVSYGLAIPVPWVTAVPLNPSLARMRINTSFDANVGLAQSMR